MAFCCISTRSAMPNASAPPDEPSPMTHATTGTRSPMSVSCDRAMAPDCPRCSAPTPGAAPGVSISVTTGKRRRAAIANTRIAFR